MMKKIHIKNEIFVKYPYIGNLKFSILNKNLVF